MTVRASLRDKPTTVYRYFDRTGALLYVGCTSRRSLRMFEHSAFAFWWPDVARCTVAHYATAAEGFAVEKEAIRAEQPRYNTWGLPMDTLFVELSVTASALHAQGVAPSEINERIGLVPGSVHRRA